MIDLEYLRSRLAYDPVEGLLHWRAHPNLPAKWNGRFAGEEAFTAISNGYRVGRLDGVKYYAHRLIFALAHGVWPEQVDHINHDRLDNRLLNLRAASPALNSRNQPLGPRNTSGVIGVGLRKSGRWCARLKAGDQNLYLGTFDSRTEAASARKHAEEKYGFHPNHGLQKEAHDHA